MDLPVLEVSKLFIHAQGGAREHAKTLTKKRSALEFKARVLYILTDEAWEENREELICKRLYRECVKHKIIVG